MAQSARRYYAVGDYMVGKQIGAGSFSTVWHARHRVHGTEVAIKEIVTARLNPKLQESLKSEIVILKRIDHPNIIRLHDMIEEPGKIYIILEYCKGGDLSMYIQQRKGRVPEATAKHFMQQLAEGLKVLRENNLIHRDLKPQNLLLSTNSDNSALKIADFGFARSLEDRNLAETLCGSPLYMAPEIMRLQKYDAKADLWSVGAILFQLVTGRTPFTGNNQIQLLQNIIKSTDLQFPPEAPDLSPDCIDLCRKLLQYNPALRLRFEEFFNHPFLSQRQPEEPRRNNQSEMVLDDFPLPKRDAEQSSQEDCLPFSFSPDDDSPVPHGNLFFPKKSMYGFDSNPDLRNLSNIGQKMDLSNYRGSPHKTEIMWSRLGSRRFSEGNLKKSLKTMDLGFVDNRSKVLDSLETIVQDYVIVSGSQIDLSKPSHFASKHTNTVPTSSVPLIRGASGRVDYTESVESQLSAPGTSHESTDIADTFEQPSTDYMTRINSLQCAAAAITELVNDKIEAGKPLEAFSVQLVILAIRKQALHICHTQAASAIEGSPSQESPDISLQIERAFLHEVEHAEELAKEVEPGNMEMPDAMELIYQSALDLGKHGAVNEYMGDMESAVVLYTKAVRLLVFVLVEAPCLILNPPFSLTNTDRHRIKNYIDVLNNRQSISRSQRMAILRAD